MKKGYFPTSEPYEKKARAIFELFAFSYMVFGVDYRFARVLGTIAVSLSSLMLYFMGKKLHSPFAGIFVMVIFGLIMAWGSLDGPHISQTETFMDLFSILSFFHLERGGNEGMEAVGCALRNFHGLSIAFKQIAVTTAFGLIVFSSYTMTRAPSISSPDRLSSYLESWVQHS